VQVELSATDEALLHAFTCLLPVFPPPTPFSARDYLRGLIDGDGSVAFTGTGLPFVSFVSQSQALAEFFCQQVLAVSGALRNPKRNTRDGIYPLMVASDPAATMAVDRPRAVPADILD